MSFLDNSGVTYLWEKIKAKFVPLDEDSEIDGTLGADVFQSNEVDTGHVYCSDTDNTSINTEGGIQAQGAIMSYINTAENSGSASTFKVTTYTATITGTGTINKSADITTTGGYYPLGVVGYYMSSTSSSYLNVYICRIESPAKNSCHLNYQVRNTSSTSANAPLNVNILWAKAV